MRDYQRKLDISYITKEEESHPEFGAFCYHTPPQIKKKSSIFFAMVPGIIGGLFLYAAIFSTDEINIPLLIIGGLILAVSIFCVISELKGDSTPYIFFYEYGFNCVEKRKDGKIKYYSGLAYDDITGINKLVIKHIPFLQIKTTKRPFRINYQLYPNLDFYFGRLLKEFHIENN